MKKLLTVLFALLLVSGIVSQTVSADETVKSYTVSLDKGGVEDATVTKNTAGFDENGKLPYGTKLSFGAASGPAGDYTYYVRKADDTLLYTLELPENSKYYIKGIIVSGQYLDSELDMLRYGHEKATVTEDLYMVPVYGVKGERVSYRVEYRLDTEDGEELLTADTFYCNKGDYVIVNAKHIDDLHIVKNTLAYRWKIDEDNTVVLIFTYRELEAGETVIYDETYQYEPGQPTGTTPGGNEGTEPVDIIDIDDPEPPTTDPEPTPGPNPTPNPEPEPEPKPTFWEILFSTPWLIGSVSAALIMLLLFLFFLFRRRREKDEK